MLLVARELRLSPLDGEPPLLNAVDLRLCEGDRVLLRGRSGSGKSTLLRCLAMLDPRARGRIEFRGSNVTGDSVPSFRSRVSFVAQTPPRFAMSVEESLRRAHSFAHVDSDYDESKALALLSRLHLPRTLLKRNLKSVSGGEAQRLALARALLLEPTVLLLDEVTSALDDENAESVIGALEDWFAEGGRAGIAITHGAQIWGGEENRRLKMVEGRLVEETVD